ncbi:hypothetical protein SPRG_14757 [Saprolegnia parasitica CBS 223.65]|uniref:CHAT domain-containing protein n=1 Tax=Saprolegnia parasitica (strain CBS 223.65) TaxID=695850 RepID=A0A067BYS4_SAPPC|nr:hypothetical protein SPRG_14757 [Saprolegnia parasitica CBS 223.65]KDO19677.1 hypothetical protein SPRG_14757 [Saprolegnia parasitica CBS 223.65]|eukprot:XP_012209594.1 hypothetical protein SPRG_14757 [Saprolegnia parasitica CBS 223.65]
MPGTPSPSPYETEKRPASTMALPARKRLRHDSFDLERQPCALRLVLSPDCALSAEQVHEMYSLGLGIIDVSRDYNNFAALLRADFRSIFTDDATYHRLSRFMCTFSADLAADGSMSLRIANFSHNPVTLNGKRLRRKPDDLVQLHERDMIVLLEDNKNKKPLVAYRVEDRSEDDSSIGILFASPLVELDATGTPSPLSELDFRNEYHSVRDVLKKALDKFQKSLTEDSEGAAQVHAVHKPIHVYTRLATKQSFREWSASLTILHFTGHGNDQWLYMEGSMPGPAVPVSPAEIMELLPDKMALRLVFLSSCASANIAAAFLARGVKHVIATQPASELEDKAAIAFTRHFYGSIASGRTVQEAFDVGQRAVAVLHSTANPTEVARKFILLPLDGNHEVPIFPPKEKRQPHSNSSSSLEDDLRDASQWMEATTQDENTALTPTTSLMYPTMLETTCTNFGFRNLDMYNVFVLLETNRFVTLTGDHGIGKTEMAIAIARYMDVRQRGWHRVCMASIGELQKQLRCVPNEDDAAYAARLGHTILQKLKATGDLSDWPAFAVIDDCDLLLATDALRERLQKVVEYLLKSHRSLRVLLTAQEAFEMPLINDKVYLRATYAVPPLSPLDAATLFAKLNSQPMDRMQYARLQVAEPKTTLSPTELAQLLCTSPQLQATNGNPLMILRLFEEVCTGSSEQ